MLHLELEPNMALCKGSWSMTSHLSTEVTFGAVCALDTFTMNSILILIMDLHGPTQCASLPSLVVFVPPDLSTFASYCCQQPSQSGDAGGAGLYCPRLQC